MGNNGFIITHYGLDQLGDEHESRTVIMDMNLTNGKHATVELDSLSH